MGKVKKTPAPPVKTDHPGAVSPQPGPSHIQDCAAPSASSEVKMDTTTEGHLSPVSQSLASATRHLSHGYIFCSTWYEIRNTSEDFPTSIEALLALKKNFPSLQVLTKVTPNGDYILQAKNRTVYWHFKMLQCLLLASL